MRRILPVAVVAAGLLVSACGAGAFQKRAELDAANGNGAGPSYSQSETIILTAPPTINTETVQATVLVSRNPDDKKKIDKTVAPKAPKNSATIVAAANSEFGKPAVLPLPDGNKAQVTLSAPKYFKADKLGFPEFGRYEDDRAVYFMVTVNNTSSEPISVKDMQIIGKTSNAKAPICRGLQGDDGTVTLIGTKDPDTWEAIDSLDPGKSARFQWGVVCETPKGKTLSLEVSVSGGKPKIYNTTMP